MEPGDSATKLIIGTKLDMCSQNEVTQRNISDFESHWKLPVIGIRNEGASRNATDSATDAARVSLILNYICDQLWLRDQILAGKVPQSAMR